MDLETPSPRATRSTASSARSSTTRPAGGGCGSSRVELKAIEPPRVHPGARWRSRCAPTGRSARRSCPQGAKQSAILTAEGERQAAVLRARGEAEATVVRADADATAQATRAQGRGAGDLDGLPRDPRGQPRSVSCSPTSTCRRCRRSLRATRTRSGSCRARSAGRWTGSATSSAPARRPPSRAAPARRSRPGERDPRRAGPARPRAHAVASGGRSRRQQRRHAATAPRRQRGPLKSRRPPNDLHPAPLPGPSRGSRGGPGPSRSR